MGALFTNRGRGVQVPKSCSRDSASNPPLTDASSSSGVGLGLVKYEHDTLTGQAGMSPRKDAGSAAQDTVNSAGATHRLTHRHTRAAISGWSMTKKKTADVEINVVSQEYACS